MRKPLILLSTVLLVLCILPIRRVKAAQSPKEPPVQTIYRVSYIVRELENGKVINSRSYVVMVLEAAHETSHFQAGSRVPYFSQMGNGHDDTTRMIQYQDVGTNINCTVTEGGNGPLLWTRFESSSVVPARNVMGADTPTGNPVFRHIFLEDSAAVKLGEQTLVGRLDDVATDHTYEIEATVTKVR